MRRGLLGPAATDVPSKKKEGEEREGGSSGRVRNSAYWLALEKGGFYDCLWLR